jgi:putative FmdB family regulatory protein
MPLYQFQCPKCGHEQDELLEIAERDTHVVPCEKCASPCRRVQTSQQVSGKPSYQFRMYDSKGRTVVTGRGGDKKGRWYRP